jgi:hypothetical protein
MDDQLLLQKEVLGDYCTTPARLDQFGNGSEQVEQKVNGVFHAGRG